MLVLFVDSRYPSLHQKYLPSTILSLIGNCQINQSQVINVLHEVVDSPISLALSLRVAFAFSPDCQHVAVVGLDGYLRVINYVNEK